MQRQRKNLSDETGEDDKDLSFTESELFGELDRLFKVEAPRPGDVTIQELEARYGVCHQTIRRRMAKEIAAGRWIKFNSILDGHKVVYYRKVK